MFKLRMVLTNFGRTTKNGHVYGYGYGSAVLIARSVSSPVPHSAACLVYIAPGVRGTCRL